MSGGFEPCVVPPRRRLRPWFVFALLAVLVVGLIVVPAWLTGPPPPVDADMHLLKTNGCTLELVDTTIRDRSGWQKALCLAIAGKYDRTRLALVEMSPDERATAAQVLFDYAQRIADEGDVGAAASIMELVVYVWPQSSAAVFHAGILEAALGHDDVASAHLEHFLSMYKPVAAWKDRALQVLAEIHAHVEPAARHVHLRE